MGHFTHWTMWGIDPGRSILGEGEVPTGAAQGKDGFGRHADGLPCPPRGRSHRYAFKRVRPVRAARPCRWSVGLRRAMAGECWLRVAVRAAVRDGRAVPPTGRDCGSASLGKAPPWT